MKNLVVITTALICLMFSSMSMAFDDNFDAEEIKPFDAPLMEDAVIRKYAKMANKFFTSVDEYSSDDQLASSSATRAPAAPLYYLEVYAAISSNYPSYEYFSQGQYSSVQDHGGAQMYIVTAELGYGFSNYAKMIGNNLTMYQQQPITDNGIIIGYFRWWTANGYQSGQFTYQNTSVNYPYNTMSDWIMIQ